MIKRQRKAILFASGLSGGANRTAQRMAGIRAGHEPHRRQPVATAKPGIRRAPVTPCELSAKSLMAVPRLLPEGALATRLAVLAAIRAAFDEVPARSAWHAAGGVLRRLAASLRRSAASAGRSAAPQRMAELVDAQWVDVCQEVLQEA